MFKGTLYVTNNMDLAYNMSSTNAIICISGETQNYQKFIHDTNASVATVLLPPYEAIAFELEGNTQEFESQYYNYLDSKEPTEFISIILKALIDGKNILLFLTKSESQLNYINCFMKYMYNRFGIIIGTQTNEFSFDLNYITNALSILYMNNLINGIEFLMLHHDPKYLDNYLNIPILLNKLICEINPYVDDTSYIGYLNYFKYYRDLLIKSNGTIRSVIGGVNNVTSGRVQP